MKKTIFAIVCLVALGLTATNVRADITLAYGDSYFIGFVQAFTPMPANPTETAALINSLITVPAGQNWSLQPPTSTTYYDRIASSLAGPFPQAVVTGAVPVDTGGPVTFHVSGFTYLSAQYDGKNDGDFVWFVKGLDDDFTLPATMANPLTGKSYGLSHYDLFNATSVPDGGVTLILLGGGFVVVETLRRRLRV